MVRRAFFGIVTQYTQPSVLVNDIAFKQIKHDTLETEGSLSYRHRQTN